MSDYIKREDVINIIQKANYIGDNESLRLAFEIDDILSADVVPKDFHDKTCEAMTKRHMEEIQRLMPKRGEWRHYEGELTCSNCEATYYDDIMGYIGDDVPRFCPNCGADMRQMENEDEKL